MERFLTAKHWQLFIALVGPQLLIFALMFSHMFNIASSQTTDPAEILSIFYWFPVLILVPLLVLFGWQWAIGMKLKAYIPAELQLKSGFFKATIIVPAIYMLLTMLSVAQLPDFIVKDEQLGGLDFAWIPITMVVALPLHLFSMFCMFYAMWYCAKTIKLAQLRRAVKFEDYAAEFFMLWFNLIGIWILQPRINQLVTEPFEPAIEDTTLYTN